MRSLLVLCMLLAGCGGTTTSNDAGADATNDVSSSDGSSNDSGTCAAGLVDCGGACVNLQNDPHNCGACGVACTGATSMCAGACQAPTCAPSCGAAQQCCQIDGPGPSGPPQCVDGGTCPVGCPLCK